MGYVLAIVVVLLIVAGFVTFMVLNATRTSEPADPERPDEEQENPAGIVAPDEAPLGDTTQHAGDQEGGRTVGRQDAEHSGGTGRPQGDAGGGGHAESRGGGQTGAEGEPQAPTPESERLANRPR